MANEQRKREQCAGYVHWSSGPELEKSLRKAVRDHVSIATCVDGMGTAVQSGRYRLLELPPGKRAVALLQDADMFVTPGGVAYIRLPFLTGGDGAVVPITSKAVGDHLNAANSMVGGKPLGRPAIEYAQSVLTTIARGTGVVQEPLVRRWVDFDGVCGTPTLWVDLGHEDIYEITGWCDGMEDPAEGDSEVQTADPYGWDFYWEEPAGMLDMPFDWAYYDELMEVSDGEVPSLMDALRPHVNAQDETALLKMAAWLIGAWHPHGGPYKGLFLAGPTGAAKTMTQRRLADLTDPRDGMQKSVFPKDEETVARLALRQGVVFYDDLAQFPVWFQKVLSQLASGYNAMGRGVIYRPVLANGLTYGYDRPDLRAKTLVAELRPFAGNIATEVKDAEWEAARPRVQALLFRVLRTGLARYEAIAATLRSEDRLASFEAWLVACEPATGLPEGTFHRLLHDEAATNDAHAATGAPEERALVALLEDAPGHTWTGTGQQLATALTDVAVRHGLPAPTPHPVPLVKALHRHEKDLATAHGVTWQARHSGDRMHTFTLAA